MSDEGYLPAVAKGGLGGLFLGLALGAAVGIALGIALSPALEGAQGQTTRIGQLSAGARAGESLKELPQRVGSFWREMRRRWVEAVAAGREATRQAEDDLRRRYREAIRESRRRRP